MSFEIRWSGDAEPLVAATKAWLSERWTRAANDFHEGVVILAR